MMKCALMVATVFRFLDFEKSDILLLQSMGYEVHTATNMQGEEWLRDNGFFDGISIIRHQIDFGRLPFSKDSFIAYKQLRKLLKENYFDLIHCHTPVAAAIVRIASKKYRNKGTKVIYTSHGFHFHKTSGWKSWLLYYPIEKLLAPLSDMIITINKEDYRLIQNFKVREKRYIPSVGIPSEYIHNLDANKEELFAEFNIPNDAYVILTIGELSERKNQSVIIRALAELKDRQIDYVLCGTGQKESELRSLVHDLDLDDRVIFAGQREHEWVMKLAHVVDLGAIPSRIEGLGLAGVEILSAGKPLVGSNIHGIKDYLVDGKTGITCEPKDKKAFSNSIRRMIDDKEFYKTCCENAYPMARKFDISESKKCMKENYEDIEKM